MPSQRCCDEPARPWGGGLAMPPPLMTRGSRGRSGWRQRPPCQTHTASKLDQVARALLPLVVRVVPARSLGVVLVLVVVLA